jgi:hypothetical protein
VLDDCKHWGELVPARWHVRKMNEAVAKKMTGKRERIKGCAICLIGLVGLDGAAFRLGTSHVTIKRIAKENQRPIAKINGSLIASYARKGKGIDDFHRAKINKRLSHALRVRVRKVLNGINKSANTMKLIGCDIEFFKRHIESRWKKGMTWENYGTAWHVDHIIPCALFDLTNPEEQRRCFHYSNQQPLWALVNLRKGARFTAGQPQLRIGV